MKMLQFTVFPIWVIYLLGTLNTEILILLEGNGELSLLKEANVISPLGSVYKTPPVSVPNHLLSPPSISIVLIVWSPNNFLGIPSSKITTGSEL